MNIWPNDGVYQQWRNYMFRPIEYKKKPLPCKYYLSTNLDTYKQRDTPQRFTHFQEYNSHNFSLSHRKPNVPSLHTHTHTYKKSGGRPNPAESKKFRRIRRRCQTNQSRKNHPTNIGAYKIPHLQSQFPPNPTTSQA